MMTLPKYLIGQAVKNPEPGQYWIIRTRNPFLVARVALEANGLIRLFPSPAEVFQSLSDTKQEKIVRTMADYWYKEIEGMPYGRAPADISWAVTQHGVPPCLVADSARETFVISLMSPRCLLPVLDERKPEFGPPIWIDETPPDPARNAQIETLRQFYSTMEDKTTRQVRTRRA